MVSIRKVKGVLHPEMPDILFFYIKIFLQFKSQICAYTQLKNNKLKNSSKGVRNSTERPKIRRFRRKRIPQKLA